jgi:cytochrome c-type biogenesis protein CcsB
MNIVILNWVTFIYFGAAVLYFIYMLRGENFWGKAATVTACAGLAAQTVALVVRWVESHQMGIGHVPLSNLFESLIFFSWTVMLLYLIMEWRIQNRSVGPFVTPFTFLLMAYASLSPNISGQIQPLIPALKSNWLTSHVVTCFMGYASFAIAGGLGFMYLLKGDEGRGGGKPALSLARFLPSRDALDELIYQCAILGFIFLTLGIITGAVWAHYAWGRYWGWDPKETWSLITWLVYAAMLHSRYVRGWRGRRMAVMALVGLACVLFTYLGVNYLPGLHSYIKS